MNVSQYCGNHVSEIVYAKKNPTNLLSALWAFSPGKSCCKESQAEGLGYVLDSGWFPVGF